MKVFRVLLFIFLNVFSALCATLFFVPRTWAIHNLDKPYGIESIVIVPHYGLLTDLTLLCALFFIALDLFSIKFKQLPFRRALWLLPLVLYPISATRAMFANFGSWERFNTVTDERGNSYHFLESSFLQGELLSIARLKSHSFFTDEYQVLATANGDSPRAYLHIVRPAFDAKDEYGQVYVLENKWVVGVRHANRMYMAYNLMTGTSYSGQRLYQLSPFLLIDTGSQMRQDDMEQVVRMGIGNAAGQPRLKPIFADFFHPNLTVVALAHTMVESIPPSPAAPK